MGELMRFSVLLAATCFLVGCGSEDVAPALPVVTKNSVVFLGDSITSRWPVLPIPSALNLGVPGETSEQIAARMPGIIAGGADAVFILAGTNDILLTPEATIEYIQSMAHQARDAGLLVVVATIPPTNKGLGDSMGRVQSFNGILRGWAQTEEFQIIDYYVALVDGYPGNTVDGIHPTEDGYRAMDAQFALGDPYVFPVKD